jgi:glycosyltransferase involved in cell wall biosynthesis
MTIRALAVFGPLIPSEFALWRAIDKLPDVELHVLGTDQWYWKGLSRSRVGRPAVSNVHVARPRGWVPRGPLWWWYPGLRELLRNVRPDVVHVNSEPWGVLAQQAVAIGRAKTTVVVHGADNIYMHGNGLERAARRLVLNRVLPALGGFASWNDQGIILAKQHGLSSEAPTLAAPATVPDPALYSGKSASANGTFAVGYLGRLSSEKGLDWLLEAFACSPVLKEYAHLSLAGTGPDRGRLEAAAPRLGLCMTFLGELSPSQSREYLSGLDALVVPSVTTRSVREQFGRVVVEGMLSGVPLVVSTCGALPSVVGDCGLVVPEGSVRGLAVALESLMADPALRSELAHRARRRAEERFSPELLGQQIVRFWTDSIPA